jgi:hypothetical protein
MAKQISVMNANRLQSAEQKIEAARHLIEKALDESTDETGRKEFEYMVNSLMEIGFTIEITLNEAGFELKG